MLGLFGELAVLSFLRRHLPIGWRALHLADSSVTRSDISVVAVDDSRGLEIKTTTPAYFARHGRIVSEDQIYDTDAFAYVWCLAERSIRQAPVTILGWSPIAAAKSGWTTPDFAGRREARPHHAAQDAVQTFESWASQNQPMPDYDADADDYEYLQNSGTEWRDSEMPSGEAMCVPRAVSPKGQVVQFNEGAYPLERFPPAGRAWAKVTAEIQDIRVLLPELLA